ncbi:hypothetical protein TNIN_401091 [Trichonephila inaurata madagascariensis]|uniref:Uncharacterized protein n=1 Tax=Trichonephila inaurata madagascariensis TaxID=2747483 RepID=A0A8X6Y526_9ARAC|nr:hypothetical protein TNIN_401091 [Trichonephila inaurata madagascariensis]
MRTVKGFEQVQGGLGLLKWKSKAFCELDGKHVFDKINIKGPSCSGVDGRSLCAGMVRKFERYVPGTVHVT